MNIPRIIKRILMFPVPCFHRHYIEDIELTGYKMNEKPSKDAWYHEWVDYWDKFYSQPAVLKRVKCPCMVCGKILYARCGIELSGSLHRRPGSEA